METSSRPESGGTEQESLEGVEAEFTEKDRGEFVELVKKLRENKWTQAIIKEIINPLDKGSLSSLLGKAVRTEVKDLKDKVDS